MKTLQEYINMISESPESCRPYHGSDATPESKARHHAWVSTIPHLVGRMKHTDKVPESSYDRRTHETTARADFDHHDAIHKHLAKHGFVDKGEWDASSTVMHISEHPDGRSVTTHIPHTADARDRANYKGRVDIHTKENVPKG